MKYQDRGVVEKINEGRHRVLFEDDFLEEDPVMVSTHSFESGIPTKYYDFDQLDPYGWQPV